MLDLPAHGLTASARPDRPDSGPQTIAELLDRWVAEAPDRPALIGRSGRFSYAELDREVARAAAVLGGHGAGPGVRVAACLPNDLDIVVAFLASARIGALWVGINRALAPPEKRYLLRDSGAALLLTTPEIDAELRSDPGDLDPALATLRVGPPQAGETWAEQLAAADPGVGPKVEIDPFGPAAIAYTSGTTGFPKGAVHSHHNLLLPGAVVAHSALPEAQLRQGVVLPLTILNLMVLGPLVAYQTGNCCVAMDRIDPEGIAKWVRDEQIASFASVPTILHDLLTHPKVSAQDLRSLVRPEVGGADCPEAFRDLYRARYGREVTIGYGMTEAPTSVTRSMGDASPAPGICGQPLPQIEITIRDENDQLLSADEIGEICVGASKNGLWAGVYTPMLGYWNQPEASAEALRGGVYHTGDLGTLDASGTLFIRGRRKELILRGGANIYPAEVERVLQEHPAVAVAAVLGLPDERLGQTVAAVIQLEDGASASVEQLTEQCAANLARYKVPTAFQVVSEFPRNAMGKIIKPRLEALFRERGT